MSNLEVIIPEIFLTLSIFAVLMFGVFLKNTYGLVNKICVLIIICTMSALNVAEDTSKVILEKIMSISYLVFGPI